MPRSARPEEVRASKVVEQYLGVTLTFLDTGGSLVDYVFDVDGRSGSLEVTRLTDLVARVTHARWTERDRDSPHLAPSLRSTWNVTIEGHPDFRWLARRIVSALEQLEELGTTEYESEDADIYAALPAFAAANSVLEEACVQHAKTVTFSGPTQVLINLVATGKAHGPGPAAHEIAQFVANDHGNLKKLRDAGTDEQHLWLWVDAQSPPLVAAPLHMPELPEYAIALPDRLTDVWICDELTGRGWRFSLGAGWSSFLDVRDDETAGPSV